MTKIITKYQENMKKKEILFIAIAAMSFVSCQNNSKKNQNCDTCQENCKNQEQTESSKIYDSAELIAPASYQWAYNVEDIPCVYHKNSNLLLLPGFDVNEQGEFTFALGEQTDVVRFQGTTLLERSKMEKEKYIVDFNLISLSTSLFRKMKLKKYLTLYPLTIQRVCLTNYILICQLSMQILMVNRCASGMK